MIKSSLVSKSHNYNSQRLNTAFSPMKVPSVKTEGSGEAESRVSTTDKVKISATTNPIESHSAVASPTKEVSRPNELGQIRSGSGILIDVYPSSQYSSNTAPMAVLESFPQPSESVDELDGFLAKLLLRETSSVGTVTHGQFNFDEGSDVVSSAQKFIIPVPNFQNGGGEDLVYPAGAVNKDGQDIGGQPIADWEGKPIGGPGEKGLVFFNHKDQSWQAVKGDGAGVIILNQVTDLQGRELQEKIGNDPSNLSLQGLKDSLTFAQEKLGIGDAYNSDRDFIKSKMNPLETSDTGVPQYGLYRRDDRDVCKAIYVEGSGEFQGPAATPQKFEDGAVLIRQPSGKEMSYRLIQPDAFQETYKNKDGSAIDLDKIPHQIPTA